jgi:hypothetical protein
VYASEHDHDLEGSWQITISSPPNCQGAPPACITASELSNFFRGGMLTETNTILFAAGEPNPPSFSSASDGYGVWGENGYSGSLFHPVPQVSFPDAGSSYFGFPYWETRREYRGSDRRGKLSRLSGRHSVRKFHHHNNASQQQHCAI